MACLHKLTCGNVWRTISLPRGHSCQRLASPYVNANSSNANFNMRNANSSNVNVNNLYNSNSNVNTPANGLHHTASKTCGCITNGYV